MLEERSGRVGMDLCCEECYPCCDFCGRARHGDLDRDGTTGPIGCKKHPDEEHQEIAMNCGFCDDFKCFMIKENTIEN